MPGTALLQSPGIGKSVRCCLSCASLTSRALPPALKIPLCDTSEANGSIEVLPCTQFLADPELADSYDALLRRGDFRSRRLNMRRGDCWLQD